MCRNMSEFFNSNALRLPRLRVVDGPDIVTFVKSIQEKYQRAFTHLTQQQQQQRQGPLLTAIADRRADVDNLWTQIVKALAEYLAGHPADAYAALARGLDAVQPDLNRLATRPIGRKEIPRFYRMVRGGEATATRQRMFHCPMNRRHQVGQHRYGIPGFPCLYLGGSLMDCQAECRIHDADLPYCFITEFVIRSRQKLKLLDFGYRPSVLATLAGTADARPRTDAGAQRGRQQLEAFLTSYLVCWPLIAAASIPTPHDGSPFVEEYIIPQLILQWVMKNSEWDGIRYFSARWTPPDDRLRASVNYVFPARWPFHKKKWSKRLAKKFAWTSPIAWHSSKMNLYEQHYDNEQKLKRMRKSPLR